jgi:hypothetical protein
MQTGRKLIIAIQSDKMRHIYKNIKHLGAIKKIYQKLFAVAYRYNKIKIYPYNEMAVNKYGVAEKN